MKIQVLGSGAGGGFPQWNCNCSNCNGLRIGKINALPRSQSSIAISTDNKNWILFNASPDIRSQLERFPESHPSDGVRGTGIRGVVLVDSQIDHSTGLLILREGCPIDVYTTEMVHKDLSTGYPIFNMLKHWNGGLVWHKIELDSKPFTVEGVDYLQITAVQLSGKAPPYSPHRHDPHPGDNIGLYVEDIKNGASLFYAPGLAGLDPGMKQYLSDADCILVDGTFWTDEEMIDAGVGTQRALELGHLPQSGENGMIDLLREFNARKVLIHINNTNPILIENSPERHILRDEGIEVAYDGMVVQLGDH
jgi:pyrroloquinoline quinone biosynthesis protein B